MTATLRYVATAAAMLLSAACGKSPSIDRNSTQGGSSSEIIAYIDMRLAGEYYWLDEVRAKQKRFDRSLPFDKYLRQSLLSLTTNTDDGYINSSGTRTPYSYIRKIADGTRAEGSAAGFGIELCSTVLVTDNDKLLFTVEYVYEDSPAAEAGLRRADIISGCDGRPVDRNNYAELYAALQGSSRESMSITVLHTGSDRTSTVTLHRDTYRENPVLCCKTIDSPATGRRVGYLAYASFDSGFEQQLSDALDYLASRRIDDMILDLRCNGGGSVSTSTMLASRLIGARYEGQVYAELRRNPLNTADPSPTICRIAKTDRPLDIERLTVIASDATASASEMLVVGLRGLGIDVKLVGTRTRGKNCGMDVTRRTVGGVQYEYAPVTFLNFNAEDFNDYGGGLLPDVDVRSGLGDASQRYYPLATADWGDAEGDIALRAALQLADGIDPARTSLPRRTSYPAHTRTVTLSYDEPRMTLTPEERRSFDD